LLLQRESRTCRRSRCISIYRSLSVYKTLNGGLLATELVRLEDRGIDALGLRGQKFERQPRLLSSEAAESDNLKWQHNKTGDDATIVCSNLGYDASESQKLAPAKASVSNSEFGKGLRFVAGHVVPAAAQGFFSRG
jgi:hypothetical protein